MKKNFNNKGSTMILLVMAIAIISILGVSLLGVTMMNLKIKKTNTEIKKSFYMSEGGLDKTYAEAHLIVQIAVNEANKEANSFVEKFSPTNIENLKTDLIRYQNDYGLTNLYDLCVRIVYKTYIKDGAEEYILDESNNPIVESYSFKELEIKNNAKKIFKAKYKDYIDEYILPTLNTTDEVDGKPTIEVEVGNTWSILEAKEKLELSVVSVFKGDNNIQKTTSVDLFIEVPEYNEPYEVSTTKIPVNPFWTKVISAKNLNINSNSIFTGDVYVSENVNVLGPNSSTVFNGKSAVKNKLNLNGTGSEINVKDIYTDGIDLIGSGVKFNAICSGPIESGAGVYVKNDMNIRQPNQEAKITGSYYGFSDGNGPDTSSGINIHTVDTASIKLEITDSLYLHGTSYVSLINDEGKKYQTGESISVKGNYVAYKEPLFDKTELYDEDVEPHKPIYTKDLRMDNINFRNYGDLSFVESSKIPDDKLKVHDKAYYMYFYNEEYEETPYPELRLNLPKNIKINNIHAIGNTINRIEVDDKGKLIPATYVAALDDDIFKNAKLNYYLETHRLGDETIEFDEAHPENIILDFDSEISLTSEKNILVPENEAGVQEILYVSKKSGSDIKYILNSGKYEGLIVTDKDIIIRGKVEFKGSIICGGTIIIEDANTKEFIYDKNIVAKIVVKNNLYKTVFKSTRTTDPFMDITTYSSGDTSDDSTVNVNFGGLLKFENWKIE